MWKVSQNKIGEIDGIQILYGLIGHSKGFVLSLKHNRVLKEGFKQGRDVICW